MPLLGGLDFQARVLHSDSITNKLFVGGNFGSVDGHQALGIAAWNGILWDTLGGGLPNIVRSITGFQNYVYVGGDFIYLNSPNTGLVNGFTRWNGFSFDSVGTFQNDNRSEEHTSELQSLTNLVCRLLLEKKKKQCSKRI